MASQGCDVSHRSEVVAPKDWPCWIPGHLEVTRYLSKWLAIDDSHPGDLALRTRRRPAGHNNPEKRAVVPKPDPCGTVSARSPSACNSTGLRAVTVPCFWNV